MKKIFLAVICFASIFPFSAHAQTLSEKLSGRIVLSVEENGEAWYVYPINKLRYYLGRPADAFKIMRELGLGITEADFQKIAQAGMPVEGDIDLAKKLSGRIVLEVEKNGEAWYVNPVDLKKYYLGRPADAFKIMRELGLGISRKDLALVHKSTTSESINQYSKYEYKKEFEVNGKKFYADVVEINLDNPNLKIITDAAEPYPDNGSTVYGSKALADFMIANNGFAGINGSYFCSDSSCGKQNYYFFPIYDSAKKIFINDGQLKYWTTGPIFAFDENNNFYYFKDSRDFGSVSNFESSRGVKLQAAIGNKPRLIENKMNLLLEWDIDAKQRDAKSLRNAIAYKADSNGGKGKIYLVIARNATVPDLAEIMKKMEVDYALNLDGGYSAALYYNGEYMIGPGRNIPNAIVFGEK